MPRACPSGTKQTRKSASERPEAKHSSTPHLPARLRSHLGPPLSRRHAGEGCERSRRPQKTSLFLHPQRRGPKGLASRRDRPQLRPQPDLEATGEDKYLERSNSIAYQFTMNLAEYSEGQVWDHYSEDWKIDWQYNKEKPDDTFKPWGFQPGHQVEWAKLLLQLDFHFQISLFY